MATPDCKSCFNTRQEFLDDDTLPKGGLRVPCSVCCCPRCGEVYESRTAPCRNGCDAAELTTAQELAL